PARARIGAPDPAPRDTPVRAVQVPGGVLYPGHPGRSPSVPRSLPPLGSREPGGPGGGRRVRLAGSPRLRAADNRSAPDAPRLARERADRAPFPVAATAASALAQAR